MFGPLHLAVTAVEKKPIPPLSCDVNELQRLAQKDPRELEELKINPYETYYKLALFNIQLSNDNELKELAQKDFKELEELEIDKRGMNDEMYYRSNPVNIQPYNDKAEQYLKKIVPNIKTDTSRDAIALVAKGLMLQYGIGISKDVKKAVELYQEAAAQGCVYALYPLAESYRYGTGVLKDKKKAFELYRQAAALDDTYAQYALGYSCENGLEDRQNKTQAARLYEKAAAQGHVTAQYRLGHWYLRDIGVTRNEEKIVEWFEKAFSQNIPLINNLILQNVFIPRDFGVVCKDPVYEFMAASEISASEVNLAFRIDPLCLSENEKKRISLIVVKYSAEKILQEQDSTFKLQQLLKLAKWRSYLSAEQNYRIGTTIYNNLSKIGADNHEESFKMMWECLTLAAQSKEKEDCKGKANSLLKIIKDEGVDGATRSISAEIVEDDREMVGKIRKRR